MAARKKAVPTAVAAVAEKPKRKPAARKAKVETIRTSLPAAGWPALNQGISLDRRSDEVKAVDAKLIVRLNALVDTMPPDFDTLCKLLSLRGQISLLY